MQNTHSRWTRLGALALVAATALIPASAEAKDGDVIKRGNCSARADWKLKASPESGGSIEVEGEVDSNKVGQSWHWKIKHNGSLSARGTKRTVAPSGSFTVRRVLVDLRGADDILFKARNSSSGEVCRASLTF